ncbi:hypothetical protein [Rhizobium binae]|uniref:hypothetical protein n=1 Tax=Rhizobium binae TaxID=1138190 RepID=UPI001C8321FE|nr:hypothetical protein [Rhizobium binae]MBX4941019.1 hypothetical protein [Rhizobium binae]MBX4942424.1 hypothetical protein [Rhizobium binae]MBX4949449.1 hypothetical protein [Rhizobium binae]MBX4960712.1 hypothetical protein [Rhizobium binae]MBX4982145.1 hypothetical protein [Rhizobium binae]
MLAERTVDGLQARDSKPTSDPVLTALEKLDDLRSNAVLFDVDDTVIGNAAGNNGCNKSLACKPWSFGVRNICHKPGAETDICIKSVAQSFTARFSPLSRIAAM